jgi:hypothetical protein
MGVKNGGHHGVSQVVASFAALYANPRRLQRPPLAGCCHWCYNAPLLSAVSLLADLQSRIIQLYAGIRPDGEPVVERVAVRNNEDGSYLMLHSPAFVRGLARGDGFELTSKRAGTFKVLRRAGNIAVRVYCKSDSALLDAVLTPHVTQLEGRRDIKSGHLLVYSIPVQAGFESIESVFDQQLSGSADASWSYGNVYDEHSGEPMQWWQQAAAANEMHLKRS